MRIRTTINMRADYMERITAAAIRAGVSVSVIISALLRNYADIAARREAAWGRVRYQRRGNGAEWKKVHFQPGLDEYEYCIDLRKVTKWSVSLLVAYAVENYLDELIACWGSRVDNYQFSNYLKSQFYHNDVAYWIYYWGKPPTLLTPSI